MQWVITAILFLAMQYAALAQTNIIGGGMMGDAKAGTPAVYSGPGDVVSGAYAWWGLRAYSLAKTGTKVANICNSGDANCADVNSLTNGNFDIATATGSPLNCGGVGGTCTVKTLYDQSGTTNCTGGTACDVTRSTIAARPTLIPSCVGGLPCMACAASSSQSLTSTNISGAQAQPYTVSYTAERTGAFTTSGTVWGSDSGSPDQANFTSSANTAAIYAGAVLTASATDSAFHAAQGVYNGASSDLYMDGSAHTGSAGSQGLSVGPLLVCEVGATGGNQYLTGRVAEVGVWISAFNGTQKSNLNSNQHSYWGF